MKAPWVFPVTVTVIVQVVPDGILPLFSVSRVPARVTEAGPPQPLNVGDAGLANATPNGRSSVIEVPVRVVVAPFVMLIDNWLVPPAHMALGLKLLFTDGPPTGLTCKLTSTGLILLTLMPPGPVELNVLA